jgi:hypothetical protein
MRFCGQPSPRRLSAASTARNTANMLVMRSGRSLRVVPEPFFDVRYTFLQFEEQLVQCRDALGLPVGGALWSGRYWHRSDGSR